MSTEIRIFDPFGEPLKDINVQPVLSHIINDVGDCSFTMSTGDAACTERNLQFGNWLLINDDNLPSWIGMIDSSSQARTWGAGKVGVYALSAEYIWNLRIARPTRFNGTAGAILERLIEHIEDLSAGGIKIYPGEIFKGGRHLVYPPIARPRDVVDRITRISKCDWSVTHEIVNSRLVLKANLYNGERGKDNLQVLDASNTELSDPIYSEEGEIWNWVIFMTPIQSSGEMMIGTPQRDEESIFRYGLRQYIGEMTAEETDALDWKAKAWLYDHAYPRGIITPSILNVNNLWKEIGFGDRFRWENHGVGFTNGLIGVGEKVRLTGYEMDYSSGKMASVMESTKKPFKHGDLFV